MQDKARSISIANSSCFNSLLLMTGTADECDVMGSPIHGASQLQGSLEIAV